MIPARVALALQEDGWYLRSDIIWYKENCMPESVTDRPTNSHEHIFLLTKNERYFYDAEAIKESASNEGKVVKLGDKSFSRGQAAGANIPPSGNGLADSYTVPAGRNKRSVWQVPTSPYKEAHFATFPPALITPCILAGTSEHGCCPRCGAPWQRVVEKTGTSLPVGERTGRVGHNGTPPQQSGWFWSGPTTRATDRWQPTCSCGLTETVPAIVLDPFMGAGTTGVVAKMYGRDWLGFELNPSYVTLATKRINETQPALRLAPVPVPGAAGEQLGLFG